MRFLWFGRRDSEEEPEECDVDPEELLAKLVALEQKLEEINQNILKVHRKQFRSSSNHEAPLDGIPEIPR